MNVQHFCTKFKDLMNNKQKQLTFGRYDLEYVHLIVRCTRSFWSGTKTVGNNFNLRIIAIRLTYTLRYNLMVLGFTFGAAA